MKNNRLALFSLGLILVAVIVIVYLRINSGVRDIIEDSEAGSADTAVDARNNETGSDGVSEQISAKKGTNTSESAVSSNDEDTTQGVSASSAGASDNDKTPPFKVKNSRAITPKNNFMSPRWSPDGMDVIYTSAKFKGLYLVSADGTGVRQLSDEDGVGYKVKWSKDGTKLIIKKDGKEVALDLTGDESDAAGLVDPDSIYAESDKIYYKNPQTGETETLTGDDDKYFNPVTSPDGSKVAYQGLSSGIHVKNVMTGEDVNIGQGGSFEWTPDGQGLVYNYTQDDGMKLISGDIYYASADGSEVYNITDTPDIIEEKPSISPDGKKVTYEVDGQIFVADLDEAVKK